MVKRKYLRDKLGRFVSRGALIHRLVIEGWEKQNVEIMKERPAGAPAPIRRKLLRRWALASIIALVALWFGVMR